MRKLNIFALLVAMVALAFVTGVNEGRRMGLKDQHDLTQEVDKCATFLHDCSERLLIEQVTEAACEDSLKVLKESGQYTMGAGCHG